MKYYKLIKDEQIIGVVSSNDFICYVEGCGYVRTNEQYGEFADYSGNYYRTTWMKAPHDSTIHYAEASFIEITKAEYDIFIAAIHNNEDIDNIIDDDEPEEPEEEIIDPIEQETIAYIRSSKLKEMSNECKKSIENGFSIILSDGGTHHFSLATQDQLNLMALRDVEDITPYHADGEQTKFYSASDIHAIIDMASKHKTYHTTYYNSLKAYINSLSTMEEIAAITYGISIPDEYKTDVLKFIEVGRS